MHEVVHVRTQGFTVTPDASGSCVLQLRNEVLSISPMQSAAVSLPHSTVQGNM